MELDITKMVEKITMQVKESQEEFIFETINPFCEDILQMKINKEELKQILLNGSHKQQPKTGKWIKTIEPYEAEPFILWECSNCHKIVKGIMKSDYCPNCGADMRETRESKKTYISEEVEE